MRRKLGFRVIGVSGSRFRVQGLGGILDLGPRVGSWVQGSGLRRNLESRS